MYEFHWEKRVPDTAEFIKSDVADLPLTGGALDAAFPTMTHHEFASDNAVTELARIFRSGGRLVVFDWSADADGETSPPTDERFGTDDTAKALMAAGFEVVCPDSD
jgi:ubiquinone/menaquinone biosynthesis C-methylase UbiE